MEGMLAVPGRRAGVHGPIGYKGRGNTWIFAGQLYRPTSMLVLRRRLPDVDESLPPILWGMSKPFLINLAVRYDGREQRALQQWSRWKLQSHIQNLLKRGKIKLYKLDLDEAKRLNDPDDPLFSRPDRLLASSASLPVAIQQKRLALAEEFGRVLRARWRSTVAADREFWDSPWYSQSGQLLYEVGAGVGDLIGGAWDVLTGLASLGAAAVSATAQAIWIEVKLIANPTAAQFNKAADDLRALGFDAHQWGQTLDQQWQGVKDFFGGATDLLELLYDDPWSRSILWNYLVGLRHSRPFVERETEVIRLTLTFALAELAALRAAAAGRSIAAAAQGGRIGRFTTEAMEQLGELARMLQQSKTQKLEEAIPAGGAKPGGKPRLVDRGDGDNNATARPKRKGPRNNADIAGPYIELGSKEAVAAKRVYQQSFNSSEPLVIGRLDDTAAGAELGMRRLNDPDWTINVNDAWVQGGINARKPFYLGSEISFKNLRSGDPVFPKTVFFRELSQLRDAGYVRQGDSMVPPSQ